MAMCEYRINFFTHLSIACGTPVGDNDINKSVKNMFAKYEIDITMSKITSMMNIKIHDFLEHMKICPDCCFPYGKQTRNNLFDFTCKSCKNGYTVDKCEFKDCRYNCQQVAIDKMRIANRGAGIEVSTRLVPELTKEFETLRASIFQETDTVTYHCLTARDNILAFEIEFYKLNLSET